jgi:hypothetical protein
MTRRVTRSSQPATPLFEEAAAWASAQGRHAVSNAPRPLREGIALGASEFGRLIRWGHGPDQARALLRDLQAMVLSQPQRWYAYAERLREEGITLEIAAIWAAAYEVATEQNLGGATAPERAALMCFLADNLAALWNEGIEIVRTRATWSIVSEPFPV